MKKKALLSSVLVIVLCLCLIAGSTFALFTDSTEFNIAVTSGDVEIFATAGISAVYSAKGTNGKAEDKYLIDENGYNYVHEKSADNKTFANGGTAEIIAGTLTLDRLTPGDRVDVAINVDNTSDVAIQYRYRIDTEDGGLARGMVVTLDVGTADQKSYEAFKSWTSQWFSASAPEGNEHKIAPKIISVELPVYAGNEYQSEKADQEDGRLAGEKSVSYTITVEAVQGNAVTGGEAVVAVYPTMSGFNSLKENNEELVAFDGEGSLDLDGILIDKGVVNNGTVVLDNAAIDVDFAGFQNYGNATLNDATIDAGTASDYGVISRGEAETVLNNTVIHSAGGAVAAADGAKVTFNSGSVDVNSTSTSGRYLFYAEGAGSVITINGGKFDFNKTQNQKRAYICAMAGSTVYVNGGVFGKASSRTGYTAGILTYADANGENAGKVIIRGGVFGFDPTKWVAEDSQVVKTGSVWVVTSKAVDAVVSDATGLGDALAAGNKNIVVANATFSGNALGNGHNHKDVDVKFVNCTFTGANDYNYIRNATYEGCTFDCGSENRALHFDQLFGTLTVTDCTFVSGKVRIGTSDNAAIIFNDCTFGETEGTSIWSEKGMTFYAPTTFNGCEFNNRVVLTGENGVVTFNGCTMEGGKPVYYNDNSDGIIRGGNIPTVTINP